MFPIIESTLSFGEIADYWSREIPASWNEILRILESAWWQDKLRGNSGPAPVSPRAIQRTLKKIHFA